MSSTFATPNSIWSYPPIIRYLSDIYRSITSTHEGSTKDCAFACRSIKSCQDSTNTKLQGFQDGIHRRTYVSVKTIAAPQFQSESTNQKSSQLRADKLLHNITKSYRLACASIIDRSINVIVVVLYPNVREKFANIFYRKRKKKSNQKVSWQIDFNAKKNIQFSRPSAKIRRNLNKPPPLQLDPISKGEKEIKKN